MALAETCRDEPSGGGVRTAVVALPWQTRVDRRSGVVCLTSSLQRIVGQRGRADPLGQRRRVRWTVTDRGSGFWGGASGCSTIRATTGGRGWRRNGAGF